MFPWDTTIWLLLSLFANNVMQLLLLLKWVIISSSWASVLTYCLWSKVGQMTWFLVCDQDLLLDRWNSAQPAFCQLTKSSASWAEIEKALMTLIVIVIFVVKWLTVLFLYNLLGWLLISFWVQVGVVFVNLHNVSKMPNVRRLEGGD